MCSDRIHDGYMMMMNNSTLYTLEMLRLEYEMKKIKFFLEREETCEKVKRKKTRGSYLSQNEKKNFLFRRNSLDLLLRVNDIEQCKTIYCTIDLIYIVQELHRKRIFGLSGLYI